MTARPLKRPRDGQLDYLSEYPANTDIITNPWLYFDWDAFANTSVVPNTSSSLWAIPEASFDHFTAGFQSSELIVDPLAAYNAAVPLMTFGSDLNTETPSLPNDSHSFGPATSQFVYLHDTFQSHAPQAPGQSATMNPSFPDRRYQRHKSRSNASMEVPSVHGRSVGSEYIIDSPYDRGQGGAMTPGTAQSFEFAERLPEVDHNSNGLLAHENDLIGLEINSSLQSASLEMTTTREHSRSPQGIFLEGIDPGSNVPTFALNEYDHGLPNSNPDPWDPFSSEGHVSMTLGDMWSMQYDFFATQTPDYQIAQEYSPMRTQSSVNFENMGEASMSREPSQNSEHHSQAMSTELINNIPPQTLDFPIPQNHSPMRTHSSMQLEHIGEASMSREPSQNSENQSPAVSIELINNLPSLSDHVNRKRKDAGRRKGPLDTTKKGSAKSTRRAHACWGCKMRKVTCNSDKTGECPECERFWRTKMTGQLLSKRICIRTPLEDLERVFIPDFMVEHLKHTSMDSFMKDLVKENGWLGRGKTEVRLLCGFGPPISVKGVQEFRPNGVIQIFKWSRDNPDSPKAIHTLPLGISQAGFWADDDVLEDLEQHLDMMVHNRGDLNEFADRVLRSNEQNQSSRTLKAVLQWYQDWRDSESMTENAELLLRNAIKVIMITTIFGRRLILQEIPQQFDKFFNEAPYTSRNYSRHRQCPRLINRQVKAALRVLQQRLLYKVLKEFGRELTFDADGWPICFAVATILAFSLEHIQERSMDACRANKACEGRDRASVQCLGSEEEVHKYRTVALIHVFDTIHVLLRYKSERQPPADARPSKRISTLASSLRKVLDDLKRKFYEEKYEQIQQMQPRSQVGEEPCRLISALLELIQ